MDPQLRGPGDVGQDLDREFGDGPLPAIRDSAPDIRAPIDEGAPVSGHVPARESRTSMVDAPEHDWGHAARLIFPILRPLGTHGLRLDEVDTDTLGAHASQAHAQPLVDDGPAGLVVVYAMQAGGFDVIVNGDHLLSWGIPAAEIRQVALRNLAAWSSEAAWTDEVSGDRRLLSSDTGDGWDAVRVLLTEVRDHLARELGAAGRVLVGLPERHLLIAGTLRPGDDEFAALFADFVVEHSGGADEPIDRRAFELSGGRLVDFAGAPARG